MTEHFLPEDFVARMREQLSDADDFFETLNDAGLTSIRLNSRKVPELFEEISEDMVVWNSEGRYLSVRPVFHYDPRYHSGAYYPMEASSMFLKHAVSQIDLDDGARILDLCAAPGGKSLMLKDMFELQLLVSNEIDGKRVHVLKENAIRWGTENHIVIQSEARKLQRSNLTFDLVVVDAPCSGEGLFRKDKESRKEWTTDRASGCAVRQEQIIGDTLPLIADGGYVVYSTCTYNVQENMDRVAQLVESGLEPVTLFVPDSWNIETHSGLGIGYQFWPHRVRGEGFFLSVLRKPGHRSKNTPVNLKQKVKSVALPQVEFPEVEGIIQQWEGRYSAFSKEEMTVVELLKGCGKIVKKGLYLGEIKGKDFIPSYDLAMNPRSSHYSNRCSLDEKQALDYLKGQALQIRQEKGPVLLCYKGLPLGFGKSNGQRINNLYPKHLRIH